MGVAHHGIPGGSLAHDGEAKYGTAGRAGARFERQVAGAFDHWLKPRPELVHVFHDVTGLDTVHPTSGRRLNLGTTNVDHLMLTGAGWIMADAKGVGQGQLLIEDGHGVLLTPSGERRPQPWLEDARAYSRAGAMFNLTGGKAGVMVWVLPDGVDFSHPSVRHPPCLSKGCGYLLSVRELARGELETIPELPPPYAPADPRDVEELARHVVEE